MLALRLIIRGGDGVFLLNSILSIMIGAVGAVWIIFYDYKHYDWQFWVTFGLVMAVTLGFTWLFYVGGAY